MEQRESGSESEWKRGNVIVRLGKVTMGACTLGGDIILDQLRGWSDTGMSDELSAATNDSVSLCAIALHTGGADETHTGAVEQIPLGLES